jgi:hypothetical protein
MNNIPEEIWGVVMYFACDEVFPIPAVGLSARFLAYYNTHEKRKELFKGSDSCHVISFIRASYRPIARMRQVCRATATNPKWLMDEVALYDWTHQHWKILCTNKKSYAVDFDFFDTLGRCDFDDPKVWRLAIKIWLAQPSESFIKLRKMHVDGSDQTNGVDRKLLQELGMEEHGKNVMQFNLDQPTPLDTIEILLLKAKAFSAQTKEEVGFPLVVIDNDPHGKRPDQCFFLDDMDWLPSPLPNKDRGVSDKCVRHIPTQGNWSTAWIIGSLYSMPTAEERKTFSTMKREALDRALRLKYAARKENNALRAKLKRRRVRKEYEFNPRTTWTGMDTRTKK